MQQEWIDWLSIEPVLHCVVLSWQILHSVISDVCSLCKRKNCFHLLPYVKKLQLHEWSRYDDMYHLVVLCVTGRLTLFYSLFPLLSRPSLKAITRKNTTQSASRNYLLVLLVALSSTRRPQAWIHSDARLQINLFYEFVKCFHVYCRFVRVYSFQ